MFNYKQYDYMYNMNTIPYIIVAIGPTGSGKTGLINSTIHALNLSGKYTKILLDDLIENSDVYKRDIKSIISKINDSCKDMNKVDKQTCIKKAHSIPTKEIYESFETAYINAKSNVLECDKKYPSKTCEEANDLKLEKALIAGDNIVLETNGRTIPEWLLKSKSFTSNNYLVKGMNFISSKNPYRVIFSYSIVGFEKLIVRNKMRYISSVKKFSLSKGKGLGPRLPNVSRRRFKPVVTTIRDTLIKVYDKCIFDTKYISPECGKERIDVLLIFNNSSEKSPHNLVFNSKNYVKTPKTDASFYKMIDSIFKLNSVSGRKKIRHTITRKKSKHSRPIQVV
jgi:hypothetical protein